VSRCDINGDGLVNVLDIQRETNEAIGAAPAVHDLNNDGLVNVLDVQIVVTAVTTGKCAPPPTTGTLTVNVTGIGGTVAVSGQDNCFATSTPVNCTYTYPIGSHVTISENPFSGFNAYTTGVCGPTVTISAVPIGCNVSFIASSGPPSPPKGTLTISLVGDGYVNVSGQHSCVPGPGDSANSCTYSLPVGTVVNVTPVPASGWSFTALGGESCTQTVIGSVTQACGVTFFNTHSF
jgi:hypothetical protein